MLKYLKLYCQNKEFVLYFSLNFLFLETASIEIPTTVEISIKCPMLSMLKLHTVCYRLDIESEKLKTLELPSIRTALMLKCPNLTSVSTKA